MLPSYFRIKIEVKCSTLRWEPKGCKLSLEHHEVHWLLAHVVELREVAFHHYPQTLQIFHLQGTKLILELHKQTNSNAIKVMFVTCPDLSPATFINLSIAANVSSKT